MLPQASASVSVILAVKSNYGLLLQLGNDRALLAVHQPFSVRAVTLVEPDGPGGVLIHDFFSIRSGRFQVAILQEHHDDVFIVEVHRRGDARSPCGIPYDHAVILKYLLRSGSWKGHRVAALVLYRRDWVVLEVNHK